MMKNDFHLCNSEFETVKSFLQNDYSKDYYIKRNGALIVNKQPVTVRKEMSFDHLEVHMPIEQPSSNLIPYQKHWKLFSRTIF